ncbi:probable inactive leucine-rich repeat receptor kinase XIAO [Andrographis paniculata]|uniref:probable inactive leucine-rich repeat receptor kinase XIAO n=1 Tax=Andrographis paniculata TaxID=175694 RepID=UPI0021E80D71|nr:probable inactive leucine-rich repeat receptor kinase XIAO [Andrographis paniculata]
MSNPKLTSLVFFLFVISFPTIESTTFPADTAALAAFKSAVKPSSIPPSSCLASWNFSAADPCGVPRISHFTCGVTCSGNRVVQITLDSQGYVGTLTPAISKLSQLIALDLGDNSFYGAIPSSISSITNLETLILRVNSFSGPVPAAIAKLSALETLDLSRNQLSGHLPDLSSLAGLTRLDASYNRLTGPLPSLPPNLHELALKANSLSGSLTKSSFAGKNRLVVIELSENSFTGALESWFFLLPAIQQVDLANNAFAGIAVSKPPANFNSQLVAVNLSYNNMEGLLPATFADFPALRSLAVSHNKFRGPIPWQYSKKGSPLRRLYLDGNYLNGHPPAGLLAAAEEISGSLGDNCLQNCPVSSGLCSTPQKPNSICQQAYRGKP